MRQGRTNQQIKQLIWQNSDSEATQQAIADAEASGAAGQSGLAELAEYCIPIGGITLYAGNSEPNDHFMFCYGQELDRIEYTDLFFHIGEQFGAGDGSTTFNLPDIRGRVPAGRDNMGMTSANRLTSPINGDDLGAAGGAESVTPPSQVVGGSLQQWSSLSGTDILILPYSPDSLATTNPISTSSVIQPTIILNYIIRVR